MLKSYLLVFFVSMVPLIELRGAIPIGLGMGLPILPTYLVCVVGNMIPVPFIYLFARKFLIWGYHKPLIGPICKFCIVKGEKGGRALEAKAGRGLVVALLLFVGIPLPGTGARGFSDNKIHSMNAGTVLNKPSEDYGASTNASVLGSA